MPIRQGTQVGVRCQVRLQPLFLRRTGAATAHLAAVRVQDDDVPCADIITIVPRRRIARRGAEVTEVPTGARHLVFMVAHSRTDDTPGSSPARVKRLLIFRQCPVFILRIAQRKHRREIFVDEQV